MNQPASLTGYFLNCRYAGRIPILYRFWVIVAFIVSIIGIAYVSMSAGYGTIVPQLFYIPIIYTAYFYPDRSMYVACCCGVAYSFVAAFFVVPGTLCSGRDTLPGTALCRYCSSSCSCSEAHGRSPSPALPEDDAEAIRTMIKTGENDHIEFKLQSLWSADLTKEEILSSESSEIRKYRNNASKFIIARSIAGFLNTDGGDLIIGIQEDRIKNSIQVVGIEEDYRKLQEKDRNPDGYRRMIVDSIIQKYLPEIVNTASRFIHLSFPSISGQDTLPGTYHCQQTHRSLSDIGNEELFFIRVDASTRSLTGKVLTQYILNRFSSP